MNSPPGADQRLRRWVWRVIALAVLTVLTWGLPLYRLDIPASTYLPLHTLLEFLAAAVALMVFATVWNTPAKEVSGSIIWVAVALMAAGWLDLAHALSFKGMPDFVTPASTEKGINFWLAARAILALTVLVLAWLPELPALSRRAHYAIVGLYAGINLCVFVAVLFYAPQLPSTFAVGLGVTTLKTVLEWLITAAFVLATVGFFRKAQHSDAAFPTYMAAAAAVTALSETFFTTYLVPSDAQNLLGHLYKVLGYWLVYQAMFVVSIRKPYARLAEQTALLSQANAVLRTQSLALNSIADPVVMTDLDGNVTWMNHTAHSKSASRFGWPKRPLNLFTDEVNPDARVVEQLKASVLAGTPWRGQVHVRDLAGQVMVVDRTVAPIRNESGAVEGILVVSEDITERIKAQSRHKRVLDTARDGFWITDLQGHLLEVNQAYARMSGYSEQQLLGMAIADLDASEAPADVQAHIAHVVASGHDVFESRHRRQSGEAYPVEISVTFDAESEQLFVFIRDISERVHTATQHRNLEMQLQQAQKMEAIGQLTGGIAHDFNNILASVLGYSRLALDRLVPDKQSKLAKYLGEIIQSSERARDLIRKMLTFTRTQPSAHAVPVRPAEVVNEVLAILRPSMPAGIETVLAVDPHISVLIDPGDLHQILLNLLINARDAVDAHQGRIAVRVRRVVLRGKTSAINHGFLSGPFVSIEVQDNGSGIAPEHLPRLFDPFFTTKDVGKGTGLGLSMVQGLLLRSSGQVVVESTPGRGSLFQLLFTEHVAPQAAEPLAAVGSAPGPHTGQRIWLVDDEPSVRQYLTDLLEGEGYQVTAFHDPQEVLLQFGRSPQTPDLLISDQTMPGISGVELARQLHARNPRLPIFICSGYSAAVDSKDQGQEHIAHWFPKPVPTEELLQAMADALARPSLVPAQ